MNLSRSWVLALHLVGVAAVRIRSLKCREPSDRDQSVTERDIVSWKWPRELLSPREEAGMAGVEDASLRIAGEAHTPRVESAL